MTLMVSQTAQIPIMDDSYSQLVGQMQLQSTSVNQTHFILHCEKKSNKSACQVHEFIYGAKVKNMI